MVEKIHLVWVVQKFWFQLRRRYIFNVVLADFEKVAEDVAAFNFNAALRAGDCPHRSAENRFFAFFFS